MNRKIVINVLFTLIMCGIDSIVYGQPDTGWKPSADLISKLSMNHKGINYFEERVPDYILPEVLKTFNGSDVGSSGNWESVRREEILELFRQNVYGRVPDTEYTTSFRIVNSVDTMMGGRATLKQVEISILSAGKSLKINLILFTPNDINKPVPAFLLINNRGPEIVDPMRIRKSEFWPAEEVIERGYAIAAFNNSDVDPDNFDDFRNGIHGILDEGKRTPESWGTIAAWAWGASRCLDYLETDKKIDGKKVAVVGHSRGGKTALWAAAEDKRFAMAVSNESGCGGAALARRRYGETVERINNSFPHWFCMNYRKWNNNEDSMPFDQHMLISLIAPRAVYVASAGDDLWADPVGSYLSLYYALPVYRLYYPELSMQREMPPVHTPVVTSRAAYHIRNGEHNMLLKDWNWFMDFADKSLR